MSSAAVSASAPLEDQHVPGLVAKLAGFSLPAGTVCEAWQRSKLERLCRYITRPPIAIKRLSVDDRGRVVYRYRQPFRDGSTHVVFEPLDFMARLAALVPRPRLNLTRFHGVFAPNFKYRQKIVPQRSRGRRRPCAALPAADRDDRGSPPRCAGLETGRRHPAPPGRAGRTRTGRCIHGRDDHPA